MRFLTEEREKEMKRLDETIAAEKEKAAEELLNSFDQMSLQVNETDFFSVLLCLTLSLSFSLSLCHTHTHTHTHTLAQVTHTYQVFHRQC